MMRRRNSSLLFYDRGVVLRRDVLAAGMTEWIYRAARDRLAGYAVLAIVAFGPDTELDRPQSAFGLRSLRWLD